MRSHQTEQGFAQTYSLMTSLRAEGVPRKLALITLTWAQLLAGTVNQCYLMLRMPFLSSLP